MDTWTLSPFETDPGDLLAPGCKERPERRNKCNGQYFLRGSTVLRQKNFDWANSTKEHDLMNLSYGQFFRVITAVTIIEYFNPKVQIPHVKKEIGR
jgi:hypothetical protein